MASMLPSLLQRITELPTKMHQLFRWSPATSSSSSGDSQMVDELKKLRRTMERIRARLSDAEEREFKERSVKLWLDELRGVAYDAEDVIEEVEYEVLRYRVESLTDEDGQIIKRPRTDDASFQHQILAEIQRINEQFSEISEDAENLGLLKEVGKRFSDIDVFERPPSSSLVNEQQVCGRDVDKGKLIQMLLSDSNAAAVRVVSIVGMGGLGKTTLAQLVYNDDQVKQHFQTRGWVYVSESFDVTKLTKEVLQAVEGDSGPSVSEMTNFDSLQRSLKEKLEGKRFLLVLDDVWNERQEKWEALWVCLSGGAHGSRVLITTRNVAVSNICRVSEPNMYELGRLSDEDSWSLFEKRAFGDKRSGEYPHLVTIGQKIVEKCEGLPLALKTLAGLLFGNLREDTWEDVLQSELWELPEEKDYILPALKLSYYHLPSPIKPCFAFCAVFPKDHIFDKDDLVFMWMAQGYLQATKGRRMEDVGRAYFEELLQRSLFQRGESGQIVMHDMIHDLALSIWGGECCHASDEKLATGKARHLLIKSEYDLKAFLSVEASNLKRVRTVLMNQWWFLRHDPIIQDATDHICSNMKFLRVLEFSNSRIHQMPESVGNLKHLRYLDFSDDTSIAGHKSIVRFQSIVTHESIVLPESIGALLNLQTLGIKYLRELPQWLTRLINLRHLLHGDYLEKMPRGIGQLTQLQTLPLFVVSAEENAAGIEELSTLNHLQGELTIKLNIVRHQNDGEEACILRNKQGLRALTLRFPDIPWNPQEQQCQEELIGNLQPHTNIRELRIIGYSGGRLPQWLGYSSYLSLEKIVVQGFCVGRDLSTLGRLPFLKTLHVWNSHTEYRPKNSEGMSIGRMENGAFPRLKELKINHDYESTILRLQHLTTLTTLDIEYCNELTTLDLQHLTALTTVDIGNCNELTTLDFQHLTTLTTLIIHHCNKLTTLNLQHLTALTTLEISQCDQLTTLDLQHLTALTRLDIGYCNELTTLDLQHLTALTKVEISLCDKLTTLDLTTLPRLDIEYCN